jgi:Ca-activated chloride channel family protein
MRFEYPIILLLLWLLPILGVGLCLLRRNKLIRAKKLVPVSMSRLSGSLFYTQLILLLLAFALGIVALARPQWGKRTEVVFHNGRNVAILLDVSRSMLAQDVHPNRLERSKADLVDLVAESTGERMAIIAFRSSARMLCPFTTDTAFLLETISGVDIDSAPRGETNIGQALEMTLDAFPEGDSAHNAIILISDGEDLSGKAKDYAEKAAERGIPIFCVGIGDVAGSTIPQSVDGVATGGSLRYDGETVVTKLDNKSLQMIANITKGAYIPLATAGTGKTTLGDVFKRYISRLAAKEQEEQHQEHYIERYQLFLLPAVLCLLTVGILSKGRPGVGRRVKKSASIIVLCFASITLFGSSSTNAVESNIVPLAAKSDSATNSVDSATQTAKSGSAYTLARKAQKLFNEKKFEEAAKLYDEAMLDSEIEPELLQDIYYNSGVAWLSCANFDQAIKAFDLVTDIDLLPQSKEAIGFAKYKQCISEIDAYNKNPDNMDENGIPKDFDATIKAKESHIGKLTEAIKYYREASELMLSKGGNVSHLKPCIVAINKRLDELTAEKKLFELIVKHGGKPFEVHIKELAEGVGKVYELIAPSVQSGEPNQLANNSAAKKLEELFDQWELGNSNISPQYFLANGIQSGKFASLQRYVNPLHFSVVRETLGKYKMLRSGNNEMANLLSDTENALVAMQFVLSSPPALLEQAIEFQTNACENVIDKNSLYTPIKYQKGAILFGWGFTESFTNWITKLQASEVKIFNEEIGGNCFDEQKLEKCKQVTPEAIEEIKQLNELLKDSLSSIFPGNGEFGDTLDEVQLTKANEALELMKKIYALLFPQDKNQQQQNQQQNQQQPKRQQQNQQQQEQQQDQQQQSENQQQEQDQQQQKAEQQESEQQEAQATEAKLNDKEAEELLKRLLMQERERKEKKRKQQEFIPMDRNTRDW